MKKFALRDVLLVAQFAICAMLVTSSLVAVRGLMRSLVRRYGFIPKNVTLAETDLHMAGYSADSTPQTQRQMLNAVATIPGVTDGYINLVPIALTPSDSTVFSDAMRDYRPTNAVTNAFKFIISPDYLGASGSRHRWLRGG